MNRILLALVAAPALVLSTSATSITAIYGSGNPAEGWTDSVSGELQLALRAKNRTTGDASNVNGVYTFGSAPAPRGLWNYEFSINSDISGGETKLTAYDYYLSIDTDPSQGVTALVVNPLTFWGDNSFGDNSTASGAGTEGLALLLAGSNNLVQNSQNITFIGMPLVDNATYSFELFATEKGAGINGGRLAEVDITVVVGAGGASVPDGGATAVMLGAGLMGLAALRRNKK